MKRLQRSSNSPAQRAAKVRSWQIFRLRGAFAIFNSQNIRAVNSAAAEEIRQRINLMLLNLDASREEEL